MSNPDIQKELKTNIHEMEVFDTYLEDVTEAGQEVDTELEQNALDATEEDLLDETLDNSALAIQNKTLKVIEKRDAKAEKAKEVKESVLVRKEDADTLADDFTQKNKEFRIDKDLLSELAQDIGVAIREDSSPDAIIAFVIQKLESKSANTDPLFINKSLEFLIEATKAQISKTPKGIAKDRLQKILNNLTQAKEKYYAENASKIDTAEKIIGAVHSVVDETGEKVDLALNHYRDIVHNPPELQAMRKLYEEKGYDFMLKELKGLNRYLGANFKRENLENAELGQLASAVRKMQALLGVYRQSKVAIGTIENYLSNQGFFEIQAFEERSLMREREKKKKHDEEQEQGEEQEEDDS